jgi:hypothetical protein
MRLGSLLTGTGPVHWTSGIEGGTLLGEQPEPL